MEWKETPIKVIIDKCHSQFNISISDKVIHC